MAVTDHSRRTHADPRSAPPEVTTFRPASRRRGRIAAGAALAAFAVGGNVLLYASLDERVEVVQVARNIRAGDRIAATDLRAVEVELDPTVPSLAAADARSVVGQFARVYIPSGTLLAPQLVQSRPLVAAGSAVVAVEVRPARVPSGVLERSRVMLVVVRDGAGAEPFVTTGRVVARGTDDGGVSGSVSLSVEVDEADAPTIAGGDDVRLVLLDPAVDPVTEGDDG